MNGKRLKEWIWVILLLAGIFSQASAQQMKISAGRMHSVGICLNDNGKVISWGGNDQGQLGDCTFVDRSSPGNSSLLSGARVISAGRAHTCIIKQDSTVWCWGMNDDGQLGIGNNTDRPYPVQVPGINNAIDIVAGRYFTGCLRADSTIWTWGDNSLGQLGDSSFTNRNSPVRVRTTRKFIKIGGTYNHLLAILPNDSVMAWGWNSVYQLGDGTTTNRYAPVTVQGIDSVIMVTGGKEFSILLRRNGTVYTWGESSDGRLGLNCLSTGADRVFPLLVPGINQITKVVCGEYHCYALAQDGSLYGWGDNGNRAVGNNSSSDQLCPEQLMGAQGPGSYLEDIVDVAAGFYHGLAINAAGTFFAWGKNSEGNCGQGFFGADIPYARIIGAMCNGAPMPVEYSWINARVKEDGRVNLDWASNSEMNLSHYRAEKSIDGIHFQSFAKVNRQNVNLNAATYSSDDLSPGKGHVYYRVTGVDFNGSEHCSEIKALFIDENTQSGGLRASVWPNPTNEILHLSFGTESKSQVKVALLNQMGQILKTQEIFPEDATQTEFNIKGLAPGFYFLQISQGGSSVIERVMVTR